MFLWPNEESFHVKFEFMKHRKNVHSKHIPLCKKYENGICHFRENCWFKHDIANNQLENELNNNPEIIERIFDMMEKFTERFEYIENQL